MIYLYIDENNIKLLYLKKTIFGQYETVFFEKKHETQLINKGQVINTDLLASAVKEALSLSSSKPINDKEICLILPQEAFYFLRTEVPRDIAPSAINPFIRDKVRSTLPVEIDNCLYDYFIRESDFQKVLTFYALDWETVKQYQQAISLIDLKISFILPDTLAYFKLFEKTLRYEKKENIFYVSYEKNLLSGYLFDSYGLIEPTKWQFAASDFKIEDILKEKAKKFEEDKNKLNRIILSGPLSENIRQDTFTKSVGVWTNPLKRIIPNFYQDYLKLLIVEGQKPFPILNLDVCFGAFIFHNENKEFSLIKNKPKNKNIKSASSLRFSLSLREIVIFLISFVLSFIFLLVISNFKLIIPDSLFKPSNQSVKPSVAPVKPTNTPTPTPSFKKEELKIKILNGSGTPGKAAEVKDILIKKNYQEIITGNADSFDYKTSEIKIKKSKSTAFEMISNDLKDYVSLAKPVILDEKETADIIIIIGLDFK